MHAIAGVKALDVRIPKTPLPVMGAYLFALETRNLFRDPAWCDHRYTRAWLSPPGLMVASHHGEYTIFIAEHEGADVSFPAMCLLA